jgi:membrane protease subunit HflK
MAHRGRSANGWHAANQFIEQEFSSTMPWNNGGPGPWGSSGGGSGGSGGGNGGGNGGGQRPPGGPWGQGGPGRGPGGGRGPGQFPDLDQLIASAQAFIRRLLSGGPSGLPAGGRGIALFAGAIVLIWAASGFYRVQPDEKGVVMRFGAFDRIEGSGLNYHLPWPIESVLRPAVTRINRTEVGYRSAPGDARLQETGRDRSGRDVLAESLMLTGDENIVDIDFAVFWRIRDASAYLFNTREPDVTVKAVTESAMREVMGRTPIQPAMGPLRAQIEADVLKESQTILDNYNAGVEITQVQLQKVDPPAAVIESFRDVQRATTDAERMRNEAQAYQNDIVPRARGEAARITAEAEGARQASIAEATGQTQRFLSVLTAYQAARDVTMQRMYLETMQEIVGHSPTTVIDQSVKGLVPFMPLTEMNRPATPPTPAGSSTGASSSGTSSSGGQSAAPAPTRRGAAQ